MKKRSSPETRARGKGGREAGCYQSDIAATLTGVF
jgi:hypothetical protein